VEGQVIAYVGDQPGRDMLHIELYTGKRTGDLSQSHHPPYDRRDDVFDGVAFLDRTVHSVTHWEGDNKYRYVTDSEAASLSKRWISAPSERVSPGAWTTCGMVVSADHIGRCSLAVVRGFTAAAT
jgi:hypothetical protein